MLFHPFQSFNRFPGPQAICRTFHPTGCIVVPVILFINLTMYCLHVSLVPVSSLTLIGALVVTHAMLRRLTSLRCIIIIIIVIHNQLAWWIFQAVWACCLLSLFVDLFHSSRDLSLILFISQWNQFLCKLFTVLILLPWCTCPICKPDLKQPLLVHGSWDLFVPLPGFFMYLRSFCHFTNFSAVPITVPFISSQQSLILEHSCPLPSAAACTKFANSLHVLLPSSFQTLCKLDT